MTACGPSASAAAEQRIEATTPEESRSERTRRLRRATALGVVASLVFAVLTVVEVDLEGARPVLHWRVDPSALGRALAASSPGAMLVFAVLTLSTLPLRALRWGLVVKPGGRYRDRYHATAVGFMAINLLPARLGEIARGLALASRVPGLPKPKAVGSVLLSRLLDLAGLWLCCLPLPFVLGLEGEAYTVLCVGLGGGAAALASSALVVMLARRKGAAVATWAGRHLGRGAQRFLSRFLDGLGTDVNGRTLMKAMLLSALLQIVSALAYGPLLVDAAPDAPMLWGSLFLLAVVSVGLAVPSSPSGVGVYHFALAWAVRLLGANAADAAAVAVLTHLGSVVVFVSAGLVSLLFDRSRDLGAVEEARGEVMRSPRRA